MKVSKCEPPDDVKIKPIFDWLKPNIIKENQMGCKGKKKKGGKGK